MKICLKCIKILWVDRIAKFILDSNVYLELFIESFIGKKTIYRVFLIINFYLIINF